MRRPHPMRAPFPLLLLAACAGNAPAPAAEPGVSPGWAFPPPAEVAHAANALVVSDAPLATQVGVEVLRAGGNAVDAAIATAFALAVVYPEAGNIGGGGFLVARLADGTEAALDFREKAPLGASRDMYLDERGEVTDASLVGHLASGVPGAVAGLWAAHERFGTRPWAELLAPAIRLAEEGFTVDAALARSIRGAADLLGRFPASAALLMPGGAPPAAGARWRNPDLAATLRRIAERGPAGFYEGETADLIVAEMKRGGGLITHEDLRRYQALWREPVAFEYRGHRVLSMPPPSSGGLTLALIANTLEGYPLRELGPYSTATLHLTAEAMRRAFADRNHFMGDPDFVSVPQARLLSQAYADSLRARIDPERASRSADVRPGLGASTESQHTTHFSVVDAQGNAVALTTTINELYGSGVTVAGAGFLLNDEMDDFAAKPGTPNMYGLRQGEANAIAPGKRMLSAMTPTIVLDPAGAPMLITGARGGPRIITATFQVLSNVIDHGMDIGAAVHAPRIHHQHLPDELRAEPRGLTGTQLAALRALGHALSLPPGYIGTAPSILRRNGQWTGAPDPRSGGLAAGY
ncbi:MAG TPA: gamma-glutamyltransferase [Longimicrobiales bacterium]|nr:gamma-glutamyltransferase [Longimicrobiales bacterium]